MRETASRQHLTLRLFGAPGVELAGQPVAFDTRKAVALLAYLAVTGRPQRRETLAAVLWPGLDQARARATLRRTLSVATAVGPALASGPEGVALDRSLLRCDVVDFAELAGAADSHAWRRAADLATGEFMAGFSVRDSPEFDEWQASTADRLRDRLTALLGRLVATGAAAGDPGRARQDARRRVELDPLSEPAYADLIRVTAWSGDRSEAARVYRSLVRVLDRELGVAPLPETTALHEAVRAGTLGPRPEPSPPPSVLPSVSVPDSAPPSPVGRDREHAALVSAWTESRHRGRVVAVTGPPGSGCTAVLDRLAAAAAEAGAIVIRLRGHAAEQGLPLAVAADLVRAVAGSLPEGREQVTGPLGVLLRGPVTGSIDGPGDQHRLFQATLEAVADIARQPGMPALIVVDDADLLDEPSAALLAYLARRQPSGLCTVAAWSASAGWGKLPAALIEVARPADVVALAPLGATEIARLLDDSGVQGVDPDDVLRRTGGLAMLVAENVAAAAAGRDSAAIADGVAARLDGAPQTTQQVVAAVVAVGTVADPDLLRNACGRDETETVAAVEDAVARGLLTEVAGIGYDLPHDLVRQAAERRTSLARRRLLHGRVAEALARRHAVDPLGAPAGAVARHLLEAGRDADAAGWFWRASQESRRLYAHAEALDQLRTAAGLGYDLVAVRLASAECLVRLGRYNEALVTLDQGAAGTEGDSLALAAVEHRLAAVHDRLGDSARAEEHLRTAAELVGESRDTGLLATRVHADLALVLHRQGRHDEALDRAGIAGGFAAPSDAAGRARVASLLALLALASGEPAEAAHRSAEAVALARQAGDLDPLVAALNNHARALAAAGDPAAALPAAREALGLTERQSDRHRLAALHSHVADLLHALGDEGAAMVELKASASAFAAIDEADRRPEVWTLAEW